MAKLVLLCYECMLHTLTQGWGPSQLDSIMSNPSTDVFSSLGKKLSQYFFHFGIHFGSAGVVVHCSVNEGH